MAWEVGLNSVKPNNATLIFRKKTSNNFSRVSSMPAFHGASSPTFDELRLAFSECRAGVSCRPLFDNWQCGHVCL
jgi:hypothetical protein